MSDEWLPVFPLPSVVFFPHTRLPLHVFESRYVEMVDHALASERKIVMALLKAGWEQAYHGHPEFHEIGCVGRVVAFEEVAESRYNIVLLGLQRVSTAGADSGLSYSRIRPRLLEDRPAPPEDVLRLHNLLSEMSRSLLQAMGQPEVEIERMMGPASQMPLEVLTNWACFLLNLDAPVKQKLLETDDVARRCEAVTLHMSRRIREVASASPPPVVATHPSRLN